MTDLERLRKMRIRWSGWGKSNSWGMHGTGAAPLLQEQDGKGVVQLAARLRLLFSSNWLCSLRTF